MPSGGARPGAGRPRKGAVQPDFEKILAGRTTNDEQAEPEPTSLSVETAALKELVDARADAAADDDVDVDEEEEQAGQLQFEELEPLSLRRMAGDGNEPEVTNERADLTTEQIVMLVKSPHVSCVTRKTISYTKMFKEEFWKRYCDGSGCARPDADLRAMQCAAKPAQPGVTDPGGKAAERTGGAGDPKAQAEAKRHGGIRKPERGRCA